MPLAAVTIVVNPQLGEGLAELVRDGHVWIARRSHRRLPGYALSRSALSVQAY
jgi:hypothetical protein